VLEKEREEDAIFELAGVVLKAQCVWQRAVRQCGRPSSWQNRENVLDVLNEHITQLRKFKACLEKENMEYLYELMENANKIQRIIK